MDVRISRPQMFLEVARVVAKRSTCCRLNVGAVIVHNRKIVSIGYNGTPSGENHCAGNECPGRTTGCSLTTHAEINAINYLPAEYEHHSLDIYVTDSPCVKCFRRIENDLRFERIFFGTPYRNTEHLEKAYMQVYQVLPTGWILNWKTKELVEVET